MGTELDELVRLDLHALSETLASHSPGVVELGAGEWLGVVELLTMRLTDECGGLSADAWRACSSSITYALDAAVATGSIDHREAVIRRLNLSAALLQRVPVDAEVDLLDPNRIMETFLGEIPISIEEARELSTDWRGRDLADIRRLRAAKSLVLPTLIAMRSAVGEDLDPRLKEWEVILPALP
ncbi:hypothetical protein ACFU7Z_17820 [Kitasatospora sp. NPDC057518]|uniref:hypothetical protein n=1 Tax=Kitasatospora sp. NPDC057518 TaxID=3346155 RepID=UPI00367E7BB3